jgi:hypothetical protein
VEVRFDVWIGFISLRLRSIDELLMTPVVNLGVRKK